MTITSNSLVKKITQFAFISSTLDTNSQSCSLSAPGLMYSADCTKIRAKLSRCADRQSIYCFILGLMTTRGTNTSLIVSFCWAMSTFVMCCWCLLSSSMKMIKSNCVFLHSPAFLSTFQIKSWLGPVKVDVVCYNPFLVKASHNDP